MSEARAIIGNNRRSVWSRKSSRQFVLREVSAKATLIYILIGTPGNARPLDRQPQVQPVVPRERLVSDTKIQVLFPPNNTFTKSSTVD